MSKQRNVETGARISELRQARRLKQREVADALGVAERTYQAWELGQNEVGWDELELLGDLFNTTAVYLKIGGEKPAEPVDANDLALKLFAEVRRLSEEIVEMRKQLGSANRSAAGLLNEGADKVAPQVHRRRK